MKSGLQLYACSFAVVAWFEIMLSEFGSSITSCQVYVLNVASNTPQRATTGQKMALLSDILWSVHGGPLLNMLNMSKSASANENRLIAVYIANYMQLSNIYMRLCVCVDNWHHLCRVSVRQRAGKGGRIQATSSRLNHHDRMTSSLFIFICVGGGQGTFAPPPPKKSGKITFPANIVKIRAFCYFFIFIHIFSGKNVLPQS